MEPQSNNPNREPNKVEKPAANPEVLASPDRKLESVPIGALEQLGDNAGHEEGKVTNDPQITATDLTIPTFATPTATQDDTTTAASATSTTDASDDDVIEKEWVNKAKKVINETKGDPYAKEREVSRLQADYMQKRYGKQVKMPNED